MYGNHQLARNSQVQAARARLAQRQGVPGGAQYANMAGCPVPGGLPLGVVEDSYNLAPPLPPGSANPGVVRQMMAPCGVIVQAEATGTTIVQLATRGNASFFGKAISSCNNCFEIILIGLITGSLSVNLLPCGSVDVAIFNTDDCWCPFDVGCINSISPLEIQFEAFGTPSVLPFLNMTVWGIADRAFADCGYPYGFPWGGPTPWPPYGGSGGFPPYPPNPAFPTMPIPGYPNGNGQPAM